MNKYCNEIYNLLKSSLDIFNDNIDYNNSFGIKCPYCGHTDKSPNSTHLWIKFPDNDDAGFPIWHCVKCDKGGLFTPKLLDDLEIYSSEISYEFSKLKIKNSKLIGSIAKKRNKTKKLTILPPLNNQYTINKINYIENRLGIKLSYDDILRFKLIFNLKDFLSYNHIPNYTRHEKIINSLDEKYIGFLSINNELISFRNITNNYTKYEKRYIIYDIFGLENTDKFYTFYKPDKINIMDKVKVVLCEGAFDLLGIYYHIYNKKTKNIIFMAVCGMGYENAIKYLNRLGILFADYEIYSDNTVTMSTYRKMKNKLDYRLKYSSITIFYNSIGKDYGVTKSEIKLKKYKL